MSGDHAPPRFAQGTLGQMRRFAVSGGLGFGVDTGLLYALMALSVPFSAGRALSFLGAATFTWWFNRRHTFHSNVRREASWGEWLHYLAAMAIGGAVNYGVSVWSYQSFGIMHEYPVLALALGTGVGMVFNFLSARFVVFRLSTRDK
jgi:putative flippase GtrA